MDAKERVLAIVRAEGFPYVRVAGADRPPGVAAAAQRALDDGRLADMGWMTAEWLARATDPEAFLAGARSVVMVALPYARYERLGTDETGRARGRIAGYAAGRDYHRVFEAKLRRIARLLREEFECGARATVDYGPLLERPLAAMAGLGWLGRSTMLLVPGAGPYVLLGAVATTLELEPDAPLRKTCGTCARCVTACPTGALSMDGRLDARLCISYHTIENRGPIPRELRSKLGGWIFGCDDCLDSCPPGFKHTGGVSELAARDGEEPNPELAPLLELDEATFRERYRGRAITRAKRDGFVRNVCVALGNVGTAEDVPALIGALGDTSALVRGHAAWALAQLARRLAAPALPRQAGGALAERAALEPDWWVQEELTLALIALGDSQPA